MNFERCKPQANGCQWEGRSHCARRAWVAIQDQGVGDLGTDELVVGLEDLKDFKMIHKDFPKTLPEWRREDARQVNAQFNSIRGEQWNEKFEVKEKRERARGVLLCLEERYEAVDEKITNFDSFPEEILGSPGQIHRCVLNRVEEEHECGAGAGGRDPSPTSASPAGLHPHTTGRRQQNWFRTC